jgi:hypothetical protein
MRMSSARHGKLARLGTTNPSGDRLQMAPEIVSLVSTLSVRRTQSRRRNTCNASMRCASTMVLASSLVLAGDARSDDLPQASLPITVGSKVRLLAPMTIEGEQKGIIQQVDEKSLTLNLTNRTSITVARSAITRLEVSTGQKRQWLKGMVIGAVIEGVGLAATATIQQDCSASSSSGSLCFSSRAEALGVGVAAGALVGAGIGALFKGDRWSAVPLEAVRVSLAPTRRRGLVLSVSVGF